MINHGVHPLQQGVPRESCALLFCGEHRRSPNPVSRVSRYWDTTPAARRCENIEISSMITPYRQNNNRLERTNVVVAPGLTFILFCTAPPPTSCLAPGRSFFDDFHESPRGVNMEVDCSLFRQLPTVAVILICGCCF